MPNLEEDGEKRPANLRELREILEREPSFWQQLDNKSRFKSWRGVVFQCAAWVMSPSHDETLMNPNFDPSTSVEDQIAIYFVHGTADRAYSLKALAEALIKKGLPPQIIALRLLSFEQRFRGLGIDEFKNQLSNKVKRYQEKKIIEITFSRGSLQGAAAAADLVSIPNNSEIQTIANFFLAGPFMGSNPLFSPLQYISDSVRDMQTNSEFLQNLHPQMEQGDTFNCFLGGELDALVGKGQEFVPLKRAFFHHELKGHGHLSLPTSSKVALIIHTLIHLLLDPKSKSELLCDLEVEWAEKMKDFIYIAGQDHNQVNSNLHQKDEPDILGEQQISNLGFFSIPKPPPATAEDELCFSDDKPPSLSTT